MTQLSLTRLMCMVSVRLNEHSSTQDEFDISMEMPVLNIPSTSYPYEV